MNKIEELADWQTSPIFTRDDGSYVITYGGHPYHVPPETDEFAELWTAVNAWAKAHPKQVEPEPGPPEPTLDEARAARLSEIASGYDAALTATLTMPSNKPGAADIATEAALFAATDPVGLADVRAILAARRAELEAQINAAATVTAIKAIAVTYPV